MADLMSNGLYENVMISYYAILLKVDQMYNFVNEIPFEMVIGQQMKEEGYNLT